PWHPCICRRGCPARVPDACTATGQARRQEKPGHATSVAPAIIVEARIDAALLDAQHVAFGRHRIEEAGADVLATITQARAYVGGRQHRAVIADPLATTAGHWPDDVPAWRAGAVDGARRLATDVAA